MLQRTRRVNRSWRYRKIQMRRRLFTLLCLATLNGGGCRSAEVVYDPVVCLYETAVDVALDAAFPSDETEYERQDRAWEELQDE
jgi:hypothetical protein